MQTPGLPDMMQMMHGSGGGAVGNVGLPPLNGGGGGNPMADMGMQALEGLSPKSTGANQALDKVDEALRTAYKLVAVCITQVNQWSPEVAKELHMISKQLLQTQIKLKEERPPEIPPDLLMDGSSNMGMPTGSPFNGPSGDTSMGGSGQYGY